MDELSNPAIFLSIFGLAVAAYGAAIARSGDPDMLPLRARASVANRQEVRRVGRVSCVTGLIILAMALVAYSLSLA